MNDKDHKVNNIEQSGMLAGIDPDLLLDPLWAYDDFTSADDRPATSAGLVNLGFITATIRRTKRFWCATTVAGLLVGFGLFLAAPPAYQASSSLFITHGPNANPTTAIGDDQVVAESHAVARLAMHELGLAQSVSSFDAAYTVTAPSDRVLLITVNAPSTTQAVKRANAVAAAFLQFRAHRLEAQQKLELTSLRTLIGQVRNRITVVTNQIGNSSSHPTSSAGRAELSGLRTERAQAAAELAVLEQTLNTTQASTAVTAAVKGSYVIDAATPIPHSRLKLLVTYTGTGLLVGLVLGLGIVVVRALMSDKLRRREEVARALGAPVKVSVGTVRRNWRPDRSGRADASGAEVQRIAAHLRNSLPTNSRGVAALAIVAADDSRVPASSLVSLAASCANQGKQVVLADLYQGAPAAMLLGVKGPGVHAVKVGDARMIVAVPDRDDALPVGPRGSQIEGFRALNDTSAPGRHSAFTHSVSAALAPADLLLVLASVDPSLGGEHLLTWADDAIVVMTAGRSSWAKIHAVGEMIRLAGLRLVSAVLVGADKTDESLGVAHTSAADRNGKTAERGIAS